MCRHSAENTGADCSEFRFRTPPQAREDYIPDAVRDGFWLKEWRRCLSGRPRVCPETVARDIALSGKGAILTTMHKFLHPPTRTRKGLQEFVRHISRQRTVVIDEIHRWDTWHQFQSHQFPHLMVPPKPGKNAWTLTGKGAGNDYIRTLEAWLTLHAQAANKLYDGRQRLLPDLQANRLRLLAGVTHRVPLFPDGITLRDMDEELVKLVRKRKGSKEEEPGGESRGLQLARLEKTIASGTLGELVFTCTPRFDTEQNQAAGWDYQLAALDIASETKGDRLLRIPQFTILRAIVKAAEKTTLLSATPPSRKEIEFAIQAKLESANTLPGPGLDILLEQSSRSQRHLTFGTYRRKTHPGDDLVDPVIRRGRGILFLRSKREHDHPRWRRLPEASRSYCRGPESVGKQNQTAKFVALAGPPHLPASLEPYCFTDPVDNPPVEDDHRTAAIAGSRARTWLMLQELYQATSRTGNLDKQTRATAIVFGCPERIIPSLLDPNNQPEWARHEAEYSILRGQGSTGYAARRLAIRSYLEGTPLRYDKPPRKRRGLDGDFVRPAVVDEWYWIMQTIQRGKLSNPFTAKSYLEARRRHGRRRSNLLKEIVDNWNPKDGVGDPFISRSRHWPRQYTFDLVPLKQGWSLDLEGQRSRRTRKKR